MRTMTATEASRHFKDVLDSVEDGETVVVTRAGRQIAVIAPSTKPTGRLVKDILASRPDDREWSDDLADLRSTLQLDDSRWSE